MWKAVVLVLAGCLLACGSRAMEGPTYGVKLCGREFIRAVIFTCGGSRWRRSLRSTGETLASSPLVQGGVAEGAGPQEGLSREWSRLQGGVFSRPVRSLITNDILEALRTSDRKGRDVVVGLSNACCKWGCSKSEISSLC
ncbi:relaxin-3-like [Clupea harengus]|uniref:Relaxin-3 n=1 Tax=Clupea harengus TaxID=7950 RepID=A0A6P3WCL3_CLUHA|nr:relaxin-3-like [Clupea harengus]